MAKLINTSNLDTLAKGLNNRTKELVDIEKNRAMAVEGALENSIADVLEMFDGKAFKYVTQEEYDNLSEEQKNDTSITWCITDAEDVDMDLYQTVYDESLETSVKNIPGAINELHVALNNLAGSDHDHDDKYYTETEIDAKLDNKADKEHTHEDIENDITIINTDIDNIQGDIRSLNTEVSKKVDNSIFSQHDHNHIYYTKQEVNQTIIPDINETINTNVNALQASIDAKAPASHTHDDRYYTETEIDTKLGEISEECSELSQWIGSVEGDLIGHENDANVHITSAEKTKLSGIEPNANNYVHPNDHNDLYYTKDETDTKVDALHATISAEIDADVKVVADNLAREKDTTISGTLANGVSQAFGALTEFQGRLNNHEARMGNYDAKFAVIQGGGVGSIQKAEDNAKAYADQQITALVNSAPEAMNTLGELAKAISDHQDVYDAYVAQISSELEEMGVELVNAAIELDESLHSIISVEIDTDVKVVADNLADEIERATAEEGSIKTILNNKADTGHTHDDRYYTETEINSKFTTVNNNIAKLQPITDNSLDTTVKTVPGAINEIKTTMESEFDATYEIIGDHTRLAEGNSLISLIELLSTTLSDVQEDIGSLSGLTTNTNTSLVACINELKVDCITLASALAKAAPTEVVQVNVVNNTLNLTTDKYQKTTMTSGTNIVFPAVNEFTEIHLYFDAIANMNISLPDNCKWRIDPNTEEGTTYELVATYNTVQWLVNIMAYSSNAN